MRLRFALAALICYSAPLYGQVTERPVAFDTEARVRVITPGLADRLKLRPPEWPVVAPYNEVRLHETGTGGFVLVASRSDGTSVRYPITGEARAALDRTITASLAAAGNVRPDGPDNATGSSRGAFVRNQTILTAIVYAPAAASLATNNKARTAIWLLGTGGSFFALSALTNDAHITHAQNHLSTDGGIRGALLTNGALKALGVDLDDDIAVGAGLAGALGGAILGYKRGKTLTDAEAHASTTWSTFAGLTALGVAASFAAGGDSSTERVATGAIVGSAVLGYVLGPRYVRKASYTVTPGDLGVMHVTAVLGAALATIPFYDRDRVNERTLAGAMTAGFVAGIAAGDLLFTRPFDHTRSEAWGVGLGAVAGGLVGGAAVVLAEPDATAGAAMIIGSAAIGAFITDRLVKPLRARR